ncbi:MAG: dephospho-CoA kinase [Verrucomicrobiales bacterium]|nr:dephospho-CoA kinase [Verrucomicrobiales bacterium]
MNTIAITGGIACGKSRVAESLQSGLEAPLFSSDACVAELLSDSDIQRQVLELFAQNGGQDGVFDKSAIRKRAFENSDFREKLEALIHPLVYERVVDFLGNRADHTDFLLVEVPLLYEVNFPLERDLDLIVAASPATQVERLTSIRGLDLRVANQILSAQLSIDEKIRRADVVVWNDGSLEALNLQVEHLVRRCFS